MKAAVVGSGGWGTALAIALHRNGHDTVLWSHNPKKAEQVQMTRENPMLPGIKLPDGLRITGDDRCVEDCALVVIASPSVHIRSVCRAVAPYLHEDAVMVSVTKGIEPGTFFRMSQIVQEETGHPVVALTGPSHAEEVARQVPTGCLAACADKALAELVQDAFMSECFRIYTSPDIVGAELGGALKNVIALCAGTVDGLGYGDNTLAMLMTRGLTEIARLGVALGAHKETFAGLAGIGDLIVTCTSRHSRNRRAGFMVGQGMTPQQALEAAGGAVEGYYAARSIEALAQKTGVEMPIVHAAYQVLYENVSASAVVQELLHRQRRPESEDAGWL
ncbi:MAG: NAD(P)-dependent glycerol-3-phosphate dehydrogenase [Oscillospiraceae bacterium]|nr:NAD(P)-dependent glycerol-3-phosphate dehydrogenase [Oscillospiraceae bacterium]